MYPRRKTPLLAAIAGAAPYFPLGASLTSIRRFLKCRCLLQHALAFHRPALKQGVSIVWSFRTSLSSSSLHPTQRTNHGGSLMELWVECKCLLDSRRERAKFSFLGILISRALCMDFQEEFLTETVSVREGAPNFVRVVVALSLELIFLFDAEITMPASFGRTRSLVRSEQSKGPVFLPRAHSRCAI